MTSCGNFHCGEAADHWQKPIVDEEGQDPGRRERPNLWRVCDAQAGPRCRDTADDV